MDPKINPISSQISFISINGNITYLHYFLLSIYYHQILCSCLLLPNRTQAAGQQVFLSQYVRTRGGSFRLYGKQDCRGDVWDEAWITRWEPVLRRYGSGIHGRGNDKYKSLQEDWIDKRKNSKRPNGWRTARGKALRREEGGWVMVPRVQGEGISHSKGLKAKESNPLVQHK